MGLFTLHNPWVLGSFILFNIISLVKLSSSFTPDLWVFLQSLTLFQVHHLYIWINILIVLQPSLIKGIKYFCKRMMRWL